MSIYYKIYYKNIDKILYIKYYKILHIKDYKLFDAEYKWYTLYPIKYGNTLICTFYCKNHK